MLGVVGESGCGKSTLARLIMGLLPPTAGEALVDGRSLAGMDRRERARLIQPVFQDPFSSLNPRQRVRDIVSLPLALAMAICRRRGRPIASWRCWRASEFPARWPTEYPASSPAASGSASPSPGRW